MQHAPASGGGQAGAPTSTTPTLAEVGIDDEQRLPQQLLLDAFRFRSMVSSFFATFTRFLYIVRLNSFSRKNVPVVQKFGSQADAQRANLRKIWRVRRKAIQMQACDFGRNIRVLRVASRKYYRDQTILTLTRDVPLWPDAYSTSVDLQTLSNCG